MVVALQKEGVEIMPGHWPAFYWLAGINRKSYMKNGRGARVGLVKGTKSLFAGYIKIPVFDE